MLCFECPVPIAGLMSVTLDLSVRHDDDEANLLRSVNTESDRREIEIGSEKSMEPQPETKLKIGENGEDGVEGAELRRCIRLSLFSVEELPRSAFPIELLLQYFSARTGGGKGVFGLSPAIVLLVQGYC